jgi:hypothetical protein
MKRMLVVSVMVAVAFTMIALVAAPASAQWAGEASASGGTQTGGSFSQGSWSGSGCGHYCGGRTSGLSVGNSTGNEAWVSGRGREWNPDRVQFWGEASRTDSYSNNIRNRNGSVRTSGTGSVNVGVSGDSGRW